MGWLDDLSSSGLRTTFISPPIIIEDRNLGSIDSKTVCKKIVWFSFGAHRSISAIPESEPFTTKNLGRVKEGRGVGACWDSTINGKRELKKKIGPKMDPE
ncbi:hypothetical protein FKM82_007337 [Ascaphus truei]